MVDAVDTMGDDWLAEASDHVEEAPEVVEVVVQPEATEGAPETPEVREEAEPSTETPHMVPYATMKKEREARQELERRLAALEARPAPQQAPVVTQQPQIIPDAYEDPQGFNQWVLDQQAQQQFAARAEISGFKAETKFGKEIVEAAIAWAMEEAKADPTLSVRVQKEASPVEYVVQKYKRSLTHQTLGDKSPEDFAREYAVSQGWIVSQPQTETSVPQKPSSPKAPRSLATIPGSGSKAPANADWGEFKFALDN